MYRVCPVLNSAILMVQGEPGAAGLGGLHGLPGEEGAPGQKVHYTNKTFDINNYVPYGI